jgi:hypothetical protein
MYEQANPELRETGHLSVIFVKKGRPCFFAVVLFVSTSLSSVSLHSRDAVLAVEEGRDWTKIRRQPKAWAYTNFLSYKYMLCIDYTLCT